jgi:hypothetical protein
VEIGDAARKEGCRGKKKAGIMLRTAYPAAGEWEKATQEEMMLSASMVSRTTWKLLACGTRGDRVWLKVVRTWHMPTSRISKSAVTWLGYVAQPDHLYAVRLCDPTGDPGDFLFAKSASTLDIAPPEAGVTARSREASWRQPDVVAGRGFSAASQRKEKAPCESHSQDGTYA